MTINVTKSEVIGKKDNANEGEEKDTIFLETEAKNIASDDSSLKEGDKANKIGADVLKAARDETIKKYTEVCLYRL